MHKETDKNLKDLSWLQMLMSVCSAFFGVQSDKNLMTDFSKGKVWPFVAAGIFVVIVFILTLVLVVKLVL